MYFRPRIMLDRALFVPFELVHSLNKQNSKCNVEHVRMKRNNRTGWYKIIKKR